MTDEAASGDAQDLLQAAMSGLASADPHLEGTTVSRWYLVTEHAPRDGDDRFLSVFRSPDLRPWDSLGLLESAKTVENDNIMFGSDSSSDPEE